MSKPEGHNWVTFPKRSNRWPQVIEWCCLNCGYHTLNKTIDNMPHKPASDYTIAQLSCHELLINRILET